MKVLLNAVSSETTGAAHKLAQGKFASRCLFEILITDTATVNIHGRVKDGGWWTLLTTNVLDASTASDITASAMVAVDTAGFQEVRAYANPSAGTVTVGVTEVVG